MYLGISFDGNMSWECHTDMISNKLSKNTTILNELKQDLPLHINRMLHFSMVNSHINFGISFWGFVSMRLMKIKEHIIRTFTCIKYNAHIEPLYELMDIIMLKYLLDKNTLKFYYRHLLSYFCSFNVTEQDETRSYNARQSDQIETNRTRTKFTDIRHQTIIHRKLHECVR